jgi:hypothetical protein
LGIDFGISCYYSGDKGIRVHALHLTSKDHTLVDFKADGSYDLRAVHPTAAAANGLPMLQVWLDGQWEDLSRDGESSRYRRTLRNGGVVEFDMTSGRWRSASSQ